MWTEIVELLSEKTIEIFCGRISNAAKRKTLNKKLFVSIIQSVESFRDSSLDCDDFYKLISNSCFLDALKFQFCPISNAQSKVKYTDKVVKYIVKESPKVKAAKARRFLKTLETSYMASLYAIVEENPELSATLQIISTILQHMADRIVENNEYITQYFSSNELLRRRIETDEIIQFHNNCEKEFKKIKFTGIDGAETRSAIDLGKYYIENTFSYYKPLEGPRKIREIENEDEIALKDIFVSVKKIVLVGDAGLGKTTTLNYLYCNFEKIYGVELLKIKVDLKEYAKDIETDKKDMLWCLAKEFEKHVDRTKYEISRIEETIAEYLNQGRCLVIFDALDEISTQAGRNTVRDVIERFCNIYFNSWFVISSREVGYLKNQFDETFLHIRINSFGERQIRKYCLNWVEINGIENDDDQFIIRFNEEVKEANCAELITNPIILVLALIIFGAETSLPRTRVDFYKHCVETFLRSRDNRKKYKLNDRVRTILNKRSVVPTIAYYKYNREESTGINFSFTNESLRTAVFQSIKVKDLSSWVEDVDQYIKYLIERTELIRECDEGLYDFAHKTFYEYFLAVHIVKSYGVASLREQLKSWIGDSGYNELARLIIELVSQIDDAEQYPEVIDLLFDLCEATPINRSSLYRSKDISNALAALSILSDLNSNRYLQPQYLDDYHNYLLRNPSVIALRIDGSHSKRISYDEDVLVRLFEQKYKHGGLNDSIISVLYFLDTPLLNRIKKELHDDIIDRIVGLIVVLRKYSLRRYTKETKETKEILDYFFSEGIDILLKYPAIYYLMINVIFLFDCERDVSLLLTPKFEVNEIHDVVLFSRAVLSLIIQARNDSKNLLLLLLLRGRIPQMIVNRIIHGGVFSFDIQGLDPKEIQDFVEIIFQSLDESVDANAFKDIIKKENLYDPKYDYLYDDVFLNNRKRLQARNKSFKRKS
jgi:hypothetical protein